MIFKKVSSTYQILSKFYIMMFIFISITFFLDLYNFIYTSTSNSNPESESILFLLFSGIFGLIQFIGYNFYIVFFFIFIYRISKNLQLQFKQSLFCTPGWAVGYYFIPILNLFRPYQVLKDIYLVSKKGPIKTSIIAIWWTFHLISSFVTMFVLRLDFQGLIDNQSTINMLYIFSDIIDLFLYIIEFIVIKEIALSYIKNYEEGYISIDNSENMDNNV